MFKSTSPVGEDVIAAAMTRIETGPVGEAEIKTFLGVKATVARRVVDTLIERGEVYRNNREVCKTQIIYTPELHNPALEEGILRELIGKAQTALRLQSLLKADMGEVRATLETMRREGRIQGSMTGVLMIYRRN